MESRWRRAFYTRTWRNAKDPAWFAGGGRKVFPKTTDDDNISVSGRPESDCGMRRWRDISR